MSATKIELPTTATPPPIQWSAPAGDDRRRHLDPGSPPACAARRVRRPVDGGRRRRHRQRRRPVHPARPRRWPEHAAVGRDRIRPAARRVPVARRTDDRPARTTPQPARRPRPVHQRLARGRHRAAARPPHRRPGASGAGRRLARPGCALPAGRQLPGRSDAQPGARHPRGGRRCRRLRRRRRQRPPRGRARLAVGVLHQHPGGRRADRHRRDVPARRSASRPSRPGSTQPAPSRRPAGSSCSSTPCTTRPNTAGRAAPHSPCSRRRSCSASPSCASKPVTPLPSCRPPP